MRPTPLKPAGQDSSSLQSVHVARSITPASFEQTLQLLGEVPTFESLDYEERTELAGLAVPRRFRAGEVVFREGDNSDTCYLVRAGLARATREHSDGRTLTLANFGPGEMFGELAIFDHQPRSATIDMLEDTDVVAILGGDMRRLIRAHIDIGLKFAETLARRLRATNDRLARQSFQTVQSRVASVLAQLVEHAVIGPDGHPLIMSTQSDIAQLAGSSRESASRFLAVLERAGIISQGRGKITIHDAEALERYVY